MNIGNTSGNRVKTTNNDFQVVRTGRYKVPRPKVFNPSTSSISSLGPSRPINFDSARLPIRPDWTPVTGGSAAIRGTPATRTDIASPAIRSAAKNNSSYMEVLMKVKSSDPELSKNKIHQQVANLVACSTPRQLIATRMSTNELQSTFSVNPETSRMENHVKQPSTSTTSKPSENTKTTTLTNSVILVLTVGRCSAQGEVGLASIDLKRPVLTLCQISDTQNYANTITKINIFNPAEIVVPDTFMEQVQGTVIYEIIKSQFPLSTMITASRKHFCENQGKKYLKNAVLPECLSILEQTLTKYYAVSAAAALFKHIEFNHKTVFSSNTLQLEYVGVEKSMFIDTNTAIRLELVLNSTSVNTKNSLYDALNYCSTIGGRRRLRSCILQPSTDIQLIHDRQMAVEELMVTEEGDLKLLTNTMDKFSDVEKLYWLCTKVPKDSLNMSKLQGNYTLQLKSTLDVLPVLVDILKPFKSDYIRQIRKALTDSGYKKMLQIIETTINKEAMRLRGYSQSQFQRCFAIKTNLNPLLDITRTNYSELIKRFHDKVKELGEQFQTDGLTPNNSTNRGFHVQLDLKNVGRFDIKNPPSICKQVERTKSVLRFTTSELIELNYRINQTLIEVEKLTNEILFEMLKELRKYIGRVYDLCNGIADLDLILSFVKFSKKPGLCKPTFGQNIDIVNGKHPILELISVPVGNDVFASTDKNLTIITGPNMGGKSIYIRQVALLQIIAQIGCYVPATKAQFRMCDRLLTRLGFGDSIESNASTWVLEIKEINGFLPVLTNNSLVIIDELCRATTSEEGSSLAWAICEHLMQYRAFIFFATHSILLTKLQDLYCNVQNFHMEALSDSDNVLNYTHKLQPGVTRIDHYGLALARDIKLPENLVDYATEIEKCLFNTESALADTSPNAANRILDDFVVELLQLKDNELINPDKVSDLATKMIEELEKNFQVSFNCSDSSNDIMDTI